MQYNYCNPVGNSEMSLLKKKKNMIYFKERTLIENLYLNISFLKGTHSTKGQWFAMELLDPVSNNFCVILHIK